MFWGNLSLILFVEIGRIFNISIIIRILPLSIGKDIYPIWNWFCSNFACNYFRNCKFGFALEFGFSYRFNSIIRLRIRQLRETVETAGVKTASWRKLFCWSFYTAIGWPSNQRFVNLSKLGTLRNQEDNNNIVKSV